MYISVNACIVVYTTDYLLVLASYSDLNSDLKTHVQAVILIAFQADYVQSVTGVVRHLLARNYYIPLRVVIVFFRLI